MPSDFNFSLDFYNHDKISSFDSTFRRRFLFKNCVIKVAFTAQEKQLVFESVAENNFISMPAELHTIGGTCIVPFDTDYLKVFMNGRTKQVKLYYHCDRKNDQINSFLKIRSVIIHILQTRPTYQKSPNSDIIEL